MKNIKVSIQQAFNLLNQFNNKQYQANLKELKQDKFLFTTFKKRIEYFDLNKKLALERLEKLADRYGVKLIRKQPFNEVSFNENYMNYNHDSYDINHIISDFKHTLYMIENIIKAKNTDNKTYQFLKSIVESRDNDFIIRGYALDFYCHDYKQLLSIDKLSNYVWLTKNEYLSTHIMIKTDYKEYIRSSGGSYTVIDLESLKQIKL